MENAEEVIEKLIGTKSTMEYFKIPQEYLNAYDVAIAAVKKRKGYPRENCKWQIILPLLRDSSWGKQNNVAFC